ncbi:acyl carrier protein [Actinokineospora sp. NBRC 105648]|uniref:acyl carrier protein n=1 Tax=Actinokineospora sp. NBRC 105648 TaxID=3032206 RepID=UPI00249FB481|nr:acyl carrier protein [Actinokineospora sp. NBRC 105648]GLZ43739.1 actinorhodin polyketide synthase acyl carrier protein [Actinokineospora sp. NBRC 105648]
MSGFGIKELVDVLRASAGEEEDVNLEGDILDVDFESLGYDSLALSNTVRWIERDLGIALPDEAIDVGSTPRGLLDEVTRAVARVA